MVEFQIVTSKYFLDELTPYEAKIIVENLNYSNRPQWEQTRLKVLSTANLFSNHKLDPKEALQFPWETSDEEDPYTQPEDTPQAIAELKARQLELEAKINNQ